MLYFAYGANTHHGHMAHRCPGATFLSTAELPGHELVFRGVADIRPAAQQTVHGALWNITDSDLVSLDRFEGYPTLYTRRGVSVVLDRSRHGFDRALAVIYQMQPGREVAPPSGTYLDTLSAGYADCDLPEQQLETALIVTLDEHDGATTYRSTLWN